MILLILLILLVFKERFLTFDPDLICFFFYLTAV